jgi:hypothetical protein
MNDWVRKHWTKNGFYCFIQKNINHLCLSIIKFWIKKFMINVVKNDWLTSQLRHSLSDNFSHKWFIFDYNLIKNNIQPNIFTIFRRKKFEGNKYMTYSKEIFRGFANIWMLQIIVQNKTTIRLSLDINISVVTNRSSISASENDIFRNN